MGSNTVLVVEKSMPNQQEDSADAGKLSESRKVLCRLWGEKGR